MMPGPGKTVLLIEDQAALRLLIGRMLEGAGYVVLAHGNPEDALRAAESYAGAIDVLLTDVALPAMSGLDAAARLLAMRPGTPAVFISGLPRDVEAAGGGPGGTPGAARYFLAKPFTVQALLKVLGDAVAAAAKAT
jgi:CheY-like chemotaxis protein